MRRRRLVFVLAAFAASTWAAPTRADDAIPVFKVVMKDGTITPSRLEVPANRPFKIEISNEGTTPVEFESLALHKEKVLSAGANSSLMFRRVAPGEYDFFDDFHPEARAVMIAK